ncbi:hypothetical protein SO802_005167 [Lithocarpus litseifolius]|uniref:Response regulatory domain-containing protein n=1 Tax=Lithocarpus litseifolius TaxID=425828 RepID=A0AAW2DKM5_9ROSI
MKNNGSARESNTTFNNFPLGLSVLIVDYDQQSLQEMEAILRGSGYEVFFVMRRQKKALWRRALPSPVERKLLNLPLTGKLWEMPLPSVTKCVRVEDASTLLRMEGSVFHIIIIEQCLLGVNEFELLRIGREMDLPVFVTFEDGQPNIVQWSLENGTCEYRLKPIPMSVLNMVSTCMFFKKDNNWAQVQQQTNNVARVRNQRMSWTPDCHEKFVKSVQKLGGADKATPKEILQFLQSSFKGFEDVDREKIASHLQKFREKLNIKKKYRESCKKTNLPTIGGNTSCGNQSDALKT